jgi:hypothetical protein
MYARSLQKKGDRLQSILPIYRDDRRDDDKREFLGKFKGKKLLQASRVIPSFHHIHYFAALHLPSDFCRRAPRLIVILPCFLQITLSSTEAKQTLPGPANSFLSRSRYETFPASESPRGPIQLGQATADSAQICPSLFVPREASLAGRIEDVQQDHGRRAIGLGRPHTSRSKTEQPVHTPHMYMYRPVFHAKLSSFSIAVRLSRLQPVSYMLCHGTT